MRIGPTPPLPTPVPEASFVEVTPGPTPAPTPMATPITNLPLHIGPPATNVPMKPITAWIPIESDRVASIFLNGMDYGETPLSERNVSPGTYRVTIIDQKTREQIVF